MIYIPSSEYFISGDQQNSSNGQLAAGDIRRRYYTGRKGSHDPQKPSGTGLKSTKYDEIKAKCRREGRLFEDPDFPADDSVLYYVKPSTKPYVWKRPKEIFGDMVSLFIDGPGRFDINQQELGDCWMLAAMSCLSMHPKLVEKVVLCKDQSFNEAVDYDGIFRFQIWRFGKWIEVIIDDRLPTLWDYDTISRKQVYKLAYAISSESHELWTALLEKAYAKSRGGYKAIHLGVPIRALVDFTGGIGETLNLRTEDTSKLWSIMIRAQERDSLMCCSIYAPADDRSGNPVWPNGLVKSHAYSVTAVKLVNVQQSGTQQLVRLRNPWGDGREWIGDWSDDSRLWYNVSKSEKERIGFPSKNKDDGEFWMSFAEWINKFQRLSICHLGQECFDNDPHAMKKPRWSTNTFKDSWTRGTSAGGDVDSPNFWTNPQYGIKVNDVDKSANKDTVTVLISLMQKEGRDKPAKIGYAVYQVPDPPYFPLDKNSKNIRLINEPWKVTSIDRETCGRHDLRPGYFCVIPFTTLTDQNSDYLLRLFAEEPLNSREFDEPTGLRDSTKFIQTTMYS